MHFYEARKRRAQGRGEELRLLKGGNSTEVSRAEMHANRPNEMPLNGETLAGKSLEARESAINDAFRVSRSCPPTSPSAEAPRCCEDEMRQSNLMTPPTSPLFSLRRKHFLYETISRGEEGLVLWRRQK